MVAKRLDQAVKEYHERRLSDTYRFLFFDGVVLKQRGAKLRQFTSLSQNGERRIFRAHWENMPL